MIQSAMGQLDTNRKSIVGTFTGGRFRKRSGILGLFTNNKVIIRLNIISILFVVLDIN